RLGDQRRTSALGNGPCTIDKREDICLCDPAALRGRDGDVCLLERGGDLTAGSGDGRFPLVDRLCFLDRPDEPTKRPRRTRMGKKARELWEPANMHAGIIALGSRQLWPPKPSSWIKCSLSRGNGGVTPHHPESC